MSESESNSKPRIRSAANSSLPLVSIIPDDDTMKRAVKLMKEAVAAAARQSEAEERLKEIKDELAAICTAYDLEKGFRHGLVGYEFHGYQTRKTLSKERLLAQGVSAEQIDAAYVDGTPFLYSKVIAFDVE